MKVFVEATEVNSELKLIKTHFDETNRCEDVWGISRHIAQCERRGELSDEENFSFSGFEGSGKSKKKATAGGRG